MPTSSRRAAVRTEVIFSTYAIPYHTSPFQSVGWSSPRCGSRTCSHGLNFLGGFTSSGYLDVNGAASSDCVFTHQRILHSLHLLKRPESVETDEGALSKLLADKVYDYVGSTLVSLAATGPFAPFRTSHVSWCTVLRSAWCSQKRITKNASPV